MKLKELIGLITGILVLFGMMFGAYQFFENRYTPIVFAEEVKGEIKKVDQKVDQTNQKVDGNQKIMDYRFKAIQLETIENRIYRTKEEAGKSPTKPDKDRLNDLEQDRKKVLQEMKELEKK